MNTRHRSHAMPGSSITFAVVVVVATGWLPSAIVGQLQLQLETNHGQFIPPGLDATTFTLYTRTKWAWGTAYLVAPFNLTRAFTINTTSGTNETDRNVTYRVDWGVTASPGGVYIDASTAEMVVRVPREHVNRTATLVVESPNTIYAVAANLTFVFLPADFDAASTAVGPGGLGCLNNGTRTDGPTDGETEFDLQFECSCPDGFQRTSNCDEDAQNTLEDITAILSSTLVIGSAAAAILLFAVLSRRRSRREMRKKPEDMEAVQYAILSALGAGDSMSLQADEIGFTLTFDSALSAAWASAADGDAMLKDIDQKLMGSLRKLSALPARLTKMLKEPDTVLAVRAADSQAVLKLKRPKTYQLATGSEERFAVALQDRASREKIDVDGLYFITDVAIAMPIRVPRELDRHAITRLGMLGQGNFSEVYKASLSTSSGLPVALIAAIKTSDGSARTELLKEAALMALFEHKNVVQLLGIVTVPRDMPAMLVLEYCENGTLLQNVHNSDPRNLDTSMLLTYCHDVGCGLNYLSSRRIVHRDVAARNVLLDAVKTCKVSDFGMSTTLAGESEDSDYASNYVRMGGGELPVRWASVEVLTDGKYSKASDIWAYGVLVYEVMSRGQQPYSEFNTLTEVAERIKSGYRMQCPIGCPVGVHQRMMLPCWEFNASLRPGFTKLNDVLVDLGAVPHEDAKDSSGDDDVAAENGKTRKEKRRRYKKKQDPEYIAWKKSFDDRRTLGPSVHHICTVLAPSVVLAVKPPWKNHRGNSVSPPESATISDAVDSIVKPASKLVPCPRDGQRGCAYVDTLTQRSDVGHADALLSYTWGYKITSVASALKRWTDRVGRESNRTYIWVCSLCLNQHRMAAAQTPEQLAAEFGPRVQSIGQILPMLEPWDSPVYLTRAWCLFELYTAIGERGKVEIDIIFTEEENRSFLLAMSSGGYKAIDTALEGIKSENATATRQADLRAIQALIESVPGGYPVLNSKVKQHLEKWFATFGAVKSAARITRDTVAPVRSSPYHTMNSAYSQQGASGSMAPGRSSPYATAARSQLTLPQGNGLAGNGPDYMDVRGASIGSRPSPTPSRRSAGPPHQPQQAHGGSRTQPSQRPIGRSSGPPHQPQHVRQPTRVQSAQTAASPQNKTASGRFILEF